MATQDLTVLLPILTADRSDDIVVGSTPVTIFVYSEDGTYPVGFSFPILRKVGTNYQPCARPDRDEKLYLTSDRLEWTAYAPGVYAVDKRASNKAYGIGTDSI